MYMEPIVRAKAAPASPALRFAVGLPVLLLSVIVMLPWLAANMLVSGIVLGVLALARGPRAMMQGIDYAGRVALGR